MTAAVRHLCVLIATTAVATVAACASSNGVGTPDAGPADASAIDALAVDATPDAEPCIPDPDGETCNGNDDDCDNRTDEGFIGVGDACDVGVGACLQAGTTICNLEGTDTVCDAVAGTPGDELCDNDADDDCDTFVDEGFPDLGMICVEGMGACITTGVNVCTSDRLTTECNALPGNGMGELCNGIDDDCDGNTDEGFQLNEQCDGGDGDLCNEGIWVCDGAGGRSCTDASGTTLDLCGGGDEDCDPASADGSEDPGVGVLCDGTDSDLCLEGVRACQGGSLVCSDTTGSTADICDGDDNDCDPASPDGSEDAQVGSACDGADSDLCNEGVRSCSGGGLVCSDSTGSTLDVCNGMDDDCDPGSADGSEDAMVGTTCDGADSDLCLEGVRSCAGGGLVCSDSSGSTVDICNGMDDDCDASSVDGSEDPLNGSACDGADSDLCLEGSRACAGGGFVCSDSTGSTVDLCNGADDDCDPASADGSEDPLTGSACDGADSDLCLEGSRSCAGGGFVCSDNTGSTLDICNGVNDDCDAASADGSEDPLNGSACDGSDGDACIEGTNSCVSGSMACSDGTGTTTELCAGNNVDEDCDGSTDEGYTRDSNPACSPTNLGNISGDTGAQVLTASSYNERWYRYRMTENDSSIGGVYLSSTIQLYSPPGVDFDLYVRCFDCTTSVTQSSVLGGLGGHYDTVYMKTDDDFGTSEDHDVVIEIRHFSSSYCANWQLTVTGNTAVSTVTCDL